LKKLVFLVLFLSFCFRSPSWSALPKGVEVTPSGTILTSLVYNSGSPDHPDLVEWAVDRASERTFTMSSRQSRLGIYVDCPEGCRRRTRAALEVDFFGVSSGAAEEGLVLSTPRLRRAFVEIRTAGFSVLFGQEDMKAFSPLDPISIGRDAIPLLSSSGNVWLRLPQLLVARRFQFSEAAALNARLAFVRPVGLDSVRFRGREWSASGMRTALPYTQVRVGTEVSSALVKAELGLSGMYGQRRAAGEVVVIQGGALDFRATLGGFRILGEGTYGKNLAPFHALSDSTLLGVWVQLGWWGESRTSLSVSYGKETVSAEPEEGSVLKSNEAFQLALGFPLPGGVRSELEYLHLNSGYSHLTRQPNNDQVRLSFAYTF